jgi:hypothetical protein
VNPGLTEEGGKVASTLIENLKTSPVTLALVIFNMLFVVVVYFGMRDQRNREETFQTKLFLQQTETMKMLYNCTPGKPVEH